METQLESDSKERLSRGLKCAFLGAVILAGCEAAIFGSVTYYSTGSGMFGPARQWAPIMVVFGAILGAPAGCILGAFLGITASGRIKSGLIGILYGLILAVIWLVVISGNQHDWQGPTIAELCIPAGAITGFLASPGKAARSDEAIKSTLGLSE